MKPQDEDIELINIYINNWNEEHVFQDKPTVIFGCNAYTKTIKEALATRGVTVEKILDNDQSKQGKIAIGIETVSPAEYISKLQPFVAIIYSSYSHAMAQQLVEAGVLKESIKIIPFRGWKFSQENNINLLIEKSKQKISSGIEIFNSVARENSGKDYMVCPYKGTGDVYMAMSYLREYMRNQLIDNVCIVVTSNSCKRICELFEMNHIVVISEEDCENLLQAWMFLGDENIHIKPLLHWGWRLKKTPWLFHNKNITFADMFRADVYGLPYESLPQKPHLNRNTKIEEILEKQGLIKGRTVVLAPYANSVDPEMSIAEWEEIAFELKKRNYCVVTNCAGAENPINGTERLTLSYQELLPGVEYCGCIVAIRSGVCEVISSANCKQIVIYENGIRALNYEYFGLKPMRLSNNEIPIIYSEKIDINKIIEAVEN